MRAALKESPDPDLSVVVLVADAEAAVADAEGALESARAAEKGGNTRDLIAEMKAATESLSKLTDTLDTVTADVQDTTAEVQQQAEDPAGSGEALPDSGAECTPPVPGAYACAGGPIPAEARPIYTVFNTGTSDVAVLQMPSKNIGCDVYGPDESGEGHASCYVHSWGEYGEFVPDCGEHCRNGTAAGLPGSGPAELFPWGGEGPYYGGRPPSPEGEVLPYGAVAYFNDFVFVSSEEGLTFWNAESGYGAFVNKSGFYPFSRD